jgi:hypothetical protein
MDAVIASDLAAFNAELTRLGLQAINAKCPGRAVCGMVP